jgi:hypothetical protein
MPPSMVIIAVFRIVRKPAIFPLTSPVSSLKRREPTFRGPKRFLEGGRLTRRWWKLPTHQQASSIDRRAPSLLGCGWRIRNFRRQTAAKTAQEDDRSVPLRYFALECPRTEQEHYPERTGICPRLERYCRSLGQQRRPEILPRWLHGRRGASVVRRDAVINRTEDLKCQRLRRNHHLLRLFPSLPKVPHGRLMTVPRAGAPIRGPSNPASSRCCNRLREQRLRL